MRKLLSLIFILCIAGMTALWADVATPNPVKMKQPDGSTITLRLHGDEFHSWYTSEDGKTLYKQDSRGWWKPSSGPRISSRELQQAREMRAERDRMFSQRSKDGLGLGWGSNHFLIILVEWSDYKFQDGSVEYFKEAIGQKGYSGSGFIGSVKDYYYEASYGQFDPNFDVYGPITLDRSVTNFDSRDNDHHFYTAQAMVREAVAKLDETIDLSQYDCNGDGYIDNVYMIHAGYDSSNGAENSIWSHAWHAYDGVNHDGVYINSYGTSAELQGNSGAVKDGIGTFCHEFGHVIGLPDLYDTDYSTNGSAYYPGTWNLMADGSRNSESKIPARLSTLERYILGYLTDADKVDLSTSFGNKNISPLSAKKFYYLPTANEGEYFILEVHDGKVWDIPMPEGMIIYHIDNSQNDVAGMTAAKRWDDWNLINGYASHPCDYIFIPDESLMIYGYYFITGEYFASFSNLWTFPTSSQASTWSVSYNVTEYAPKAWDGSQPWKLSNISYSGGTASFTLGENQRAISGIVKNSDNNPVYNAAVFVSVPESTPSGTGRALSLNSVKQRALYQTTTDSEGKFLIDLADGDPTNLEVSVFATGYLASSQNVTTRSATLSFTLSKVITGNSPVTLSKVSWGISQYGYWGYDVPKDYTVAQKYTAAELTDYVGGKIDRIDFGTAASGDEIWVFVDFGSKERVAKRVYSSINTNVYANAPANTVDVSDLNLTIPANTDVYVGYLIKNANAKYPMYTDYGVEVKSGGFLMYYEFSTTEPGGTKWIDPKATWGWGSGNALINMAVTPSPKINPNATLGDLGISYIDVPSGKLTAGTSFPLRLVSSKGARKANSIEWLVDGVSVTSGSFTLTSGKHVIQVKLRYDSEMEDKLEVRIDVE